MVGATNVFGARIAIVVYLSAKRLAQTIALMAMSQVMESLPVSSCQED